MLTRRDLADRIAQYPGDNYEITKGYSGDFIDWIWDWLAQTELGYHVEADPPGRKAP